jgi:uncharacterized protein with HEPN domain
MIPDSLLRAAADLKSDAREVFMADRMRQDAIIRKLEVIGEAVKHHSDGTEQCRPEISWRRMAL